MGRAYGRMLITIVVAYAVIIGLNETVAGGPGRLLVLGYLLWGAVRLRDGGRSWHQSAVWAGTGAAFVAAVVTAVLASAPVASGLVGGASFLLTAAIIAILAVSIVQRPRVDTPAVLGVLAVYLLLALLFASLNQLFAAFNPDGYLNGVTGLPTAADQLYFSVVTMATLGFGDIVPASQVARAVVVVEALVGQLYLVSVVAAVVGGWHRGRPSASEPGPNE
jgi:hypothetical protein